MTDAKTAKPDAENLTSGRLLARNTVWSLAGQVLPLAAALLAIPFLMSLLGTARFGILALAWVAIGYFSLFDLGLGRALTKLIAEKLANRQEADLAPTVRLALLLIFLLGTFTGVAIYCLTPWLVRDILGVSQRLEQEAISGFYWIAFAIPIVTASNGLNGVLEAHQKFGLSNSVRIPMGVCSTLGPLAAAWISPDLVSSIAAVALIRILAALALLVLCARTIPGLFSGISVHRLEISRLIRFGGWMTVVNVVGPVMDYLDRYLIGAILSIQAVAHYTPPFDVIIRLRIFPAAVASVLFPAFATTALRDVDRARTMYWQGVTASGIVAFPLALFIGALSFELMEMWLGSDLARRGAPVMQVLVIGVFLNSIAQIPFVLIQGAGRPDYLAKIYALEVPFYLIAMWPLLEGFGILGAAIAWTGRVAIDTLILFTLSRHVLQVSRNSHGRTLVLALTGTAVLSIPPFLPDLSARLAYCFVAFAIFVFVSWRFLLGKTEKAIIGGLLKRCVPAVPPRART